MGFAVRVRSAGQKYRPTCHQRDGADVTEFVTLVRLSSLGQHVDVLALAGYKRRKSARTASPIAEIGQLLMFSLLSSEIHKTGNVQLSKPCFHLFSSRCNSAIPGPIATVQSAVCSLMNVFSNGVVCFCYSADGSIYSVVECTVSQGRFGPVWNPCWEH